MEFFNLYTNLFHRLDSKEDNVTIEEVIFFIHYYKNFPYLEEYIYNIFYKAICKYLLFFKAPPVCNVCYCKEAFYLINNIIGTPLNFTQTDINNVVIKCLKNLKIKCSIYKCSTGFNLLDLPSLGLSLVK